MVRSCHCLEHSPCLTYCCSNKVMDTSCTFDFISLSIADCRCCKIAGCIPFTKIHYFEISFQTMKQYSIETV